MNYIEAMNYITQTSKFGSNLGLTRTLKILEFLGNPQQDIKCIHIGGTNGKGSTTAMINAILVEAGFKVGMYTSPYLEEFEERIQINNLNISKDDLAFVVTEVAKAVDMVIAFGYDHPTEFEIITCAMFLYFYRNKVDYAVIEVGLGGRLDSTNVINPLLSIITSISYDHMNILGDTLNKIANEKAGIIKCNTPVIVYPQEREAIEVIDDVAIKNHSKVLYINKEDVKYLGITSSSYGLNQNIEVVTYKKRYKLELALLGQHQLLNCALAVNAIEQLSAIENINIKEETILNALRKVKWPGRLEMLSTNPLVVIDGAHNIDGIINLKDNVQKYFQYDNLIIIIGILADKQVDEMLDAIIPLGNKIIAVTPHSDRASSAEELRLKILRLNENCESIAEYSEAYKKALSYCNEKDMILICGSLYMIGDMRKIIKKYI